LFQVLESTCSVDITYFPFDTQTCILYFVAWSYSKYDVDLNIGSNGVQFESYEPNSQWYIKSTSASETNTNDASVIFEIQLSRKPSFYMLNIVCPVILLSVLNCFSFVLPVHRDLHSFPTRHSSDLNIVCPVILLSVLNCFSFVLPVASGERAGYAITVFLSMAVFLTIVASELPKNSDNTSLLSIYLTCMTTLSTIIVMICLLEVRLLYRDESSISKPYHYIYRLYRLTCRRRRVTHCEQTDKFDNNSSTTYTNGKLEHYKNNEHGKANNEHGKANNEHGKENNEPGKENNSEHLKWSDIVNAIDFLAFWLCMLFTFLCTVIINSIASSKQ